MNKYVYLKAYIIHHEDGHAYMHAELSDSKTCNGHNVRRGGIRRGKTTVTVFCGTGLYQDYITKSELQAFARDFLDDKTHIRQIDFR